MELPDYGLCPLFLMEYFESDQVPLLLLQIGGWNRFWLACFGISVMCSSIPSYHDRYAVAACHCSSSGRAVYSALVPPSALPEFAWGPFGSSLGSQVVSAHTPGPSLPHPQTARPCNYVIIQDSCSPTTLTKVGLSPLNAYKPSDLKKHNCCRDVNTFRLATMVPAESAAEAMVFYLTSVISVTKTILASSVRGHIRGLA